jgi:hypothetical protein
MPDFETIIQVSFRENPPEGCGSFSAGVIRDGAVTDQK